MIDQTIGDNVTKGYDLFGDHGRNLPTPHGSGARPMYADMGKSCRPDPTGIVEKKKIIDGIRCKIEYPHVVALFTLDSHNTSYFYKREDGTYYWHHCRKNKDDVYVDADELQLDLLGNDPVLSTEYIMKAILQY